MLLFVLVLVWVGAIVFPKNPIPPFWHRGESLEAYRMSRGMDVHDGYSITCARQMLRGGLVVGRWTCDSQVASSIPLSRNTGQLSLASLRGH